MIVNLHGVPGSGGKITAHEIPKFQKTLTVVQVGLVIKKGAAVGPTEGSMWPPNGIRSIRSELLFRHKFSVGTDHHYELIEVDGLPVTSNAPPPQQT